MKKFLVFAALLFVMSAVVFAQELKFDGYLNSGLGVAVNDILQKRRPWLKPTPTKQTKFSSS